MKKRILIYGIGTFLSKILVFLMVPIYTRIFSTNDFGYYDVLISDMQMIVSIAFIEIWSGIIRFMFDNKNRYKPIKTMLRMMPALMLLYASCVFILSFIVEIKYPVITVVYGISYLLFSLSNSICRGLEENLKYALSGCISTFVSCTLSVVFAVGMHLGIEYLLIAQITGYFFAILYIEISTESYRKAMKTSYQAGSIKEMSFYCLPLMINSFSFLFLGTFNKNIIIQQLGESMSGVYAYISRFSAVAAILLSIYALAWQEQAFTAANSDDIEEQYSYYLNEFVKLIGLVIPVFVMICIIFSPFWGGEQYYNTEVYIPLAILSCYISNLSGVIGTVIAVKKKTNYILYSTIIGAAVNVIIATVTIKKYGLNASALSLSVGFGITTYIRFYFAKKNFNIAIQWHYLVLMITEILAVLGMIFFVDDIYVYIGVMGITIMLWGTINYKTLKNIFIMFMMSLEGKNRCRS